MTWATAVARRPAGRAARHARVSGERGAAPLEFGLGVAVLVLPVAVMVLTVPTWVERQSAARVAAREAARAAVLTDSTAAAVAAGQRTATEVAVNHGLEPSTFDVAITGTLSRDDSITATVTAHFPATAFPGIGGVRAFTWSTVHTEKVDRYRSFSSAPP